MGNHKTCTACGDSKPLTEFYRNRRNRDGRGPRCLDCHREQQRVYRESNREMLNKKRREYVKANPEKVNAYNRKYRDEHPDWRSEQDRKYYAANAENRRSYRRQYVETNPHTVWLNTYSRRVVRYGLTPIVEDFTKDDVINRYGDQCWHCNEGQFEELDHYPVAVAQGGPHSLGNVRPSCRSCNRARSNDAHT